MSKTHWKAIADKSEYLGKQHIDPEQDLIATIETVEESETFNGRKKETARVLYFVEPNIRPMILNSTNGGTISDIYGSPYVEDWRGKKIAIFLDPNVPNPSGGPRGGLRIRPYAPKDETAVCECCGQIIEPYDGYSVNKIVKRSRARWGESLCWDCSVARIESEKGAE